MYSTMIIILIIIVCVIWYEYRKNQEHAYLQSQINERASYYLPHYHRFFESATRAYSEKLNLRHDAVLGYRINSEILPINPSQNFSSILVRAKVNALRINKDFANEIQRKLAVEAEHLIVEACVERYGFVGDDCIGFIQCAISRDNYDNLFIKFDIKNEFVIDL